MQTSNLIDLSGIRHKSLTRAANIHKTSSMTGVSNDNNNDLGLYVIKQGNNHQVNKGNSSYNTSLANMPQINAITHNGNYPSNTNNNNNLNFEDSFDTIKGATLNLRSGSQENNPYSIKIKGGLNNSHFSSVVSLKNPRVCLYLTNTFFNLNINIAGIHQLEFSKSEFI